MNHWLIYKIKRNCTMMWTGNFKYPNKGKTSGNDLLAYLTIRQQNTEQTVFVDQLEKMIIDLNSQLEQTEQQRQKQQKEFQEQLEELVKYTKRRDGESPPKDTGFVSQNIVTQHIKRIHELKKQYDSPVR